MNKYVFCFLLTLITLPSFAEDKKRNLDVPNHFHDRITNKWQRINRNIDSFFSGDNFEEEQNESSIRFNFIYKRADGKGEGSEYNLRLQTDFPNTSKELNLIIKKESEERDGDDSGNISSDTAHVPNNVSIPDAFSDNLYSAAGRWHFFKKRGWKAHADGGMLFDVPLDPFVKLRVRKRFNFSKSYFDVVQKITYYRINQLEHETDFDYHRELSGKFKLQFINVYSYRHIDGFYRLSNTLTLFQHYTDEESLAYSISATGETAPVYAYNNYSATATLKSLLYDNWLYGQIILGTNFARENNFNGSTFSLWKMEAHF